MINFTLVVQIIHFWVAYFILTRLLLKPAYDLIMADEQQARALDKQIHRVELSIGEQSVANKREWVQLQGDLQKQIPLVRHEIVKAEAFEQQKQLETVSSEEIQTLVARMRDVLVHRVSNDTCH